MRIPRILIPALACMFSPAWCQQPTPDKPTTTIQTSPVNTHNVKRQWHDLAYSNGSAAQKLDIYLPDGGTGPYPVIVAIHGGGFDSGDKASAEVNPQMAGLERGYAVVSINYRLSGEAKFPAAVFDVKAAVRFLRAAAGAYQLDPRRIALWGTSAGANLASVVGTSAGVADMEDRAMGSSAEASNVQAVVDFYGPTDFAAMEEQFAQAGVTDHVRHDPVDSAESRYMGFQISAYPDRAAAADPTRYISEKTCPFFIENGTNDTVVPAQQHMLFAMALKQVIGVGNVTHVVLHGAGHGGPQFEDPANLDRVFTFLDRHLKYMAITTP